jgi:hypothetical protein
MSVPATSLAGLALDLKTLFLAIRQKTCHHTDLFDPERELYVGQGIPRFVRSGVS